MRKQWLVSAGFAIALSAIANPAAAQQKTFWQVFNDTTLDRIMEQARRGNHSLEVAEARIDDAGASRTLAALDLAPAVSVSGGYTRRRLANVVGGGSASAAFPDQDLWDSGVDASWEVDVFGRVRNGLSARNALHGAAAHDLRAAEVALAGEVVRTYFDLRGAQGQLLVATRNAENQRRTVELTEHRLEAGRGTAFDTERARAQLSFTLAAIPTLEARVAAAQHRIAVLTGRSPLDVVPELAAPRGLPELPDSAPTITTEQLLRARPDVQSAERRVAAGQAFVSSARAGYMPRLSVAGNARYTAEQVDAFGGRGTFNYTIGPVLSWAAFDIGRVKARVDVAHAQEREAKAQYDQAVLRAQEDASTTARRYETARIRLRHLTDATAASERAAALAMQRFEGGVTDFLQVLDAERTMIAAQDQLAQGRTDAFAAYVALHQALGEAWQTGK